MPRSAKVAVLVAMVLVEGRSVRSVAREMGISRNTVDRYLGELAAPRRVEEARRPRPVWEGSRHKRPIYVTPDLGHRRLELPTRSNRYLPLERGFLSLVTPVKES